MFYRWLLKLAYRNKAQYIRKTVFLLFYFAAVLIGPITGLDRRFVRLLDRLPVLYRRH